jgi:hypothetical protein
LTNFVLARCGIFGNEKGCKTECFAALNVWLPSADSNHGPDG